MLCQFKTPEQEVSHVLVSLFGHISNIYYQKQWQAVTLAQFVFRV